MKGDDAGGLEGGRHLTESILDLRMKPLANLGVDVISLDLVIRSLQSWWLRGWCFYSCCPLVFPLFSFLFWASQDLLYKKTTLQLFTSKTRNKSISKGHTKRKVNDKIKNISLDFQCLFY